MGCDIHLHWTTIAKMAGVRNEDNITPIAEPDDTTVVTKFECDRCEGHSHSWFGLKEIKRLAEYISNQGDGGSLEYDILRGSYLCGNSFASIPKKSQMV